MKIFYFRKDNIKFNKLKFYQNFKAISIHIQNKQAVKNILIIQSRTFLFIIHYSPTTLQIDTPTYFNICINFCKRIKIAKMICKRTLKG